MISLKYDTNRNRVLSCPCGKSNQDGKFAPYIGYIDKGYCFSCSKSFFPDFVKPEINVSISNLYRDKKQETTKNSPSYIHPDILQQSLKPNISNNLISFLLGIFDTEIVSQLIDKYRIGTSKHWDGATVFWQIDIEGNVRTGKIMLYNANKGRREDKISWAHKVLKLPNFALRQCLYGEHLLHLDTKPIAIVESEKTAIIASVYLPQFTWLASGGKAGLTKDKLEVLKGRNVNLYPDRNVLKAVLFYLRWVSKNSFSSRRT